MTSFQKNIKPHQVPLKTLFPTLDFEKVVAPNMNVGSSFFEGDTDHDDLQKAARRLKQFQQNHPKTLLANGYLEQRSFYNTPAFQRKLNGAIEYRNIHLGTDFWVAAGTAVHAPAEGRVVISHNNNYHKDYGPTLVLEHQFLNFKFYTLYGHLSRSSLELSEVGKAITKGAKIGYIGNEIENGHWVPHLHFQLITDLLGNTENFNGVAFPSEIKKWKTRCPDPNLLFEELLPAGN
ncbi:MAG: hypothetical protein DWP94_00280 [Flavobacterium sp.]|nr:MAG: hypothetical protein DWP94_00280 [Flavobacterium sp.]